jgi:catechol 2,3-dioxygenase-like lactoylglutathione lyase family enzyme
MVKFAQPTVALPVRDVVQAQAEYRDMFGFEVGWHHEGGRIGAVSRGECAIFFRAVEGPIAPVEMWVFTEDVDGAAAELTGREAQIVEPLANTSWGLRQFTARDAAGHLLHFFRDL